MIEPGDDVANAKMVCTGFGHGGDGRKPFLHAFTKRPGQSDQLVMVYPQASAESAVRNQIRTWGAAADGLCAGPGPTPRAPPPGGLLLSTFGVRIACKIHHHPNDAGDMRLVRLDHGRHLERRAQLEEEVACGLPRRDMHAIGTPHIITGLPKEEPEGLALARPDTRISFPTQRSSAAVPHVRNWFRTALSAPACG